MTKAEIKAELRRSACNDASAYDLKQSVWDFITDEGYRIRYEEYFENENHERTFYLLVAEAL